MSKFSNFLIENGQQLMDAATLTKEKLAYLDPLCGGGRGLSGTDLQYGYGYMTRGFGKLLQWMGL